MGWSADQVKAATLWQFFAAWQGYLAANSPKEGNKLSEDEKDRIWERMQQLDEIAPGTLSTQTYVLDGLRLVPAGIVTFEVQ